MTPHGPYAGVVDVARNGIDEIIRLRREVQRLQRALYFWLPGTQDAVIARWDRKSGWRPRS